MFPRDHRWSQRLRPRCECRWGGSAPKPLLFCRRITASFVCLLSCSRGAAGAGMGSLGPAESSYTSMPSPRQDDFMAARVQSGAPPAAAISAMAPSQAPVCRVHEMKLSTWLECMLHTWLRIRSPPASKERFMTRYSKRIARRRVRSRCLRRDDYNTPPFAEKLKLVRADRGARCGGLRRAAAGCGGLRRAAAGCGGLRRVRASELFLARLD